MIGLSASLLAQCTKISARHNDRSNTRLKLPFTLIYYATLNCIIVTQKIERKQCWRLTVMTKHAEMGYRSAAGLLLTYYIYVWGRRYWAIFRLGFLFDSKKTWIWRWRWCGTWKESIRFSASWPGSQSWTTTRRQTFQKWDKYVYFPSQPIAP